MTSPLSKQVNCPSECSTRSEKLLPRRQGWLGGSRHRVLALEEIGKDKKKIKGNKSRTKIQERKLLWQTTRLPWCFMLQGFTPVQTRIQILMPHKLDSELKTFPVDRQCWDQAHSWVLLLSTGGQSRSHVRHMMHAHFYIILRNLYL